MTALTLLLKCSALLCALAGAWLALRMISGDPAAPGVLFARRYSERLDAKLRRLFLPQRAALIFAAQLTCVLLTVAFAIWLRKPSYLLAAVAPAFGPHLVLARMQQQRTLAVEARIDAFTLALANALRATPNIARALESAAASTSSPLREELELTLRELRVGSTLPQALRDLGVRIGSARFDSTLSALLIGQRVGGNVPEILGDTASTLREIVRLQATLRAKTADGRVQSVVLASFPVVIVFGFDRMMPGYFSPLLGSFGGIVLLAIAAVAWIVAVLMSRKILMVQI
jgi:tight adherence protein B